MMDKQKVIELWGDAPEYIIVARESWDALEGDDDLNYIMNTVKNWEEADKKEGIFEENAYQVLKLSGDEYTPI